MTLGNLPEAEKVVIVPRIVIKEKLVEVEKPIEVIVEKPIYIDRETIEYIRANASERELSVAYEMIGYAIFSHQFYAMNPALQTPITGNTTLNWEWVEKYKLIKELLDRAYKQ